LALRASHRGAVGEPAPAHPHLFRHARVRQIIRTTRNLPLAQRQAGWSRLQMAYLTIGDGETENVRVRWFKTAWTRVADEHGTLEFETTGRLADHQRCSCRT
jgi:hypothetical protein